jgi:hypothetical protein
MPYSGLIEESGRRVEMPVIRANGCSLSYVVSGSGPRLLLINGSGVTLDSSQLLLGAFSAQFELLAYDHRGLGLSGEVTEPYALSDCAADALAVLDAAGWETAPVLGISFGGMVLRRWPSPLRLGSSGWRCSVPRREVRAVRPTRCTNWRTARSRTASASAER